MLGKCKMAACHQTFRRSKVFTMQLPVLTVLYMHLASSLITNSNDVQILMAFFISYLILSVTLLMVLGSGVELYFYPANYFKNIIWIGLSGYSFIRIDPTIKKWKLVPRYSAISVTSDATVASILLGLYLYKLHTCTFAPLIYSQVCKYHL
jgi:hypothetical protein